MAGVPQGDGSSNGRLPGPAAAGRLPCWPHSSGSSPDKQVVKLKRVAVLQSQDYPGLPAQGGLPALLGVPPSWLGRDISRRVVRQDHGLAA